MARRGETDLSRKARLSYLLDVLGGTEKLVVLDIGANPLGAPPAYQSLLDEGACHVIGFEPQKEEFEALVKAAGPNESYINAAVGKSGKAFLNTFGSSGFASLFQMHGPSVRFLGRWKSQLRNDQKFEVDLKGIDEIDEITRIDLLKIDVQGAERDIIRTGLRKLANAIAIIPEMRYFRIYDGEPLMGELDQELRSHGFDLHKLMPPQSRHLANSQSHRLKRRAMQSQVIDGDAVYIRRMTDVSGWSDAQLIKLALAADSVFDSPDLALRCLDYLVERRRLSAEVPAAYADRFDAELLVPVDPGAPDSRKRTPKEQENHDGGATK